MIVHHGTRISAHRGDTDETWRIDRLISVINHARLAAHRLGCAEKWEGAAVSVHDHKGELTVHWRSLWDLACFVTLIRSAWHAHDEFTKIRCGCKTSARAPQPYRPQKRRVPSRSIPASRLRQ